MDKSSADDRWPLLSGLTIRQLIAVFFILTISACGGGSGDSPGPDQGESTDQQGNVGVTDTIVDVSDPNQCNAATQKQWAYDSMRDFYLFYDQVPVVDPQSYDSANDLVRSVRFQERDGFSHVSDAEQSALESDQGREFGLGYNWFFDDEGNARIRYVVLDSPFGRAGIERGDIILTLDGLDWKDDALDVNFYDRVFGTPENPATSTWRFEKRDTRQIVTLVFTAAEYSINTIFELAAFTGEALVGNTGYLAFSRFLETSKSELNEAFNFFQNQNITELVLDLRYNGGGRVRIARQLASLIAGSSRAGQTIYDYRFNDKYTNKNYTLDFQDNVGELGLSRVIVLTSELTASASEIVISGLQPYIDVVTIGTRTRGKPYVQFIHDRCGERLNVIEAEGFNTNGVSVFGGVPAVCYAEDDLSMDFGLSDDKQFEGLLKASIDYMETGVCTTAPLAIASRMSSTQTTLDERADTRQGVSNRGGALAE